MLTRASRRASDPPGQAWMPRPKARLSRGVAALDAELAGSLEVPRVAVGGAVEHHQRRPGGHVDPADGRGPTGQAEVALHRRLDAERLLHEVRDQLPPLAEQLLQLGAVADELQGGAEQADGGLLPGGEQVRGDADDVDDLGQLAVRERGRGQGGEHVLTGLPPAVLDVAAEAVVEPRQRAVGHGLRRRAADGTLAGAVGQGLAELLVLLLGHAQEVGDDEQRERVGVVPDQLALAAVEELVELAVGQAPDELLVLLQPLRRELPHEQVPVVAVLRRVHGRDLVAERELVPVLLDQRVHVVASLERDREAGERSGHRVARREGLGVAVDGARLVVAGHHVDAVLRLPVHGAGFAQVVEVRVRVGDDLGIAEEVGAVGHQVP